MSLRFLKMRMFLAVFLLAAAPALAQQQQPAAVNPVTGGAIPSPFQALGNVLRGQNPPPPPSTLVGQRPCPPPFPR